MEEENSSSIKKCGNKKKASDNVIPQVSSSQNLGEIFEGMGSEEGQKEN